MSIPSLSAGRVSWFGESWCRVAENLPSISSLPQEEHVWSESSSALFPGIPHEVQNEVFEEQDVWPTSLRQSIAAFQMRSFQSLQTNFNRTTTIGDLSSLNSLSHMVHQGSLDMLSTSAHMFNPTMTDRKLICRNSRKNKIQMCELSQLAKQVLCLTKPGCSVSSRSIWSTLFNLPSKRKKEYPNIICGSKLRNIREKFRVLVEKTGTRPETLRAAWRRFQDFENRKTPNNSKAKKLFKLMGIEVFYDPTAKDEHLEVMALKDFTLENSFDEFNPELVMDMAVRVMKQLDVEDDIARKTSGFDGPVPAMWRDVHTVALAMCVKMPVSGEEKDEGKATWTNIEVICHQIALLQGEKIEWESSDNQDTEVYVRQLRRTEVVERRKKRKRVGGYDPGYEERIEKRRKENESYEPMSSGDKQRAAEKRRLQLWDDVVHVMPDDAHFNQIHQLHGGDLNQLLIDVEDKCSARGGDIFEFGMDLMREHMKENATPETFKDIADFTQKTALEKMVIVDNFLGIGPKAAKVTSDVEQMVANGNILGAWTEARSFQLLSLWAERREAFYKFARNDIILRGFEE